MKDISVQIQEKGAQQDRTRKEIPIAYHSKNTKHTEQIKNIESNKRKIQVT